MKAAYTIEQDGRHAVEYDPSGSMYVAAWRLVPKPEPKFLVDLTVVQAGENRYTFRIGHRKLTGPEEVMAVNFTAIDPPMARLVARGVARAWTNGRIPITPIGQEAGSAWLLYIDATADAFVTRRLRALNA